MLKPKSAPLQRVRSRPGLQTVRPLPDWAAKLAPRALRTASKEHAEALDRIERTRHDERVATAAVEAAAAADRAGAEAAVAAGEQVPDPRLPAALGARSRAARAAEAAKGLARSSQDSYVRALHEHREALAQAVYDEHRRLHEAGAPAVSELESILVGLRGVSHLASELDDLRESTPSSRLQQFAPAFRIRSGRDPLEGSLREALDTLRGALAAEAPAVDKVNAKPAELTAADEAATAGDRAA